jgi:hypothetical protein
MRSTLATTGRSTILALLVLLAFVIAGCKQPVVAEAGKPAVAGGIEFSVGDYEARFLELNENGETFEYPRPVLVLPVTMKNVGESNFVYNPTHSSQQMSEASTPLLYLDPGAEADLPPASKTPINGVFLEKGTLEGQITESTTIAAGSAVTDLFLFELPAKDVTSLIFSIPPSMHGDEVPVLFRLPYTPKQPKGPKVYDLGETIAFGDIKFKATRQAVEYVKTKDNAGLEGYSEDPLLKVAFEITNGGKEPITYEPGHRELGQRGAALYGKSDTFKRVRFPATNVVDQLDKDQKLPPGESVTDFVLFEKPDADQTVVLEFPASKFGQAGLARVSFDVNAKSPDKPEELNKKEEKKEDG